MDLIHILMLLGAYWMRITSAKISETDFDADDIITRDVSVIGGGSSGTYAAIHLQNLGKSVVVVERKDRLGGHAETYIDPVTGAPVDIGVLAFDDLQIVKDYFALFDIPLTNLSVSGPGGVDLPVDLRTGKLVTNYTPGDITAALTAYIVQISKYPYLSAGFYLPDPVPADLLLPFGDFVVKYNLGALVQTIFLFAEGIGDLLRQPTVYVFKLFSPLVVASITQNYFLTTARHDTSELYEKAQAQLGSDALLLSSVLATDRQSSGGYVKLLVQTPSGKKLIRAKKIVISIPPKLYNLLGWDLSNAERSLFEQFGNAGYYTGVLRNTGIPENTTITNIRPDTPYNLPKLPAVYALGPTGIPGLFNVKYGSPVSIPSAVVEADIFATLKKLGNAGIPITSSPQLAIFSAHDPFELTVPTAAIKAGFYKKLYALQGQRQTYYTGAAFHNHNSAALWQFTQALLPSIVA